MFEEVKEMIDSTIYTNGRGEVTAQNINLAMQGIVEAAEEKIEAVETNVADVTNRVAELEQNGGSGNAGGSGALKVWIEDAENGIFLTEEQKAENVATYNVLIEGEHVPVIVCSKYEMSEEGFSISQTTTQSVSYVALKYGVSGENTEAVMFFIGDDMENVFTLYSDGTIEIDEDTFGYRYFYVPVGGATLTDKQKEENAASARGMIDDSFNKYGITIGNVATDGSVSYNSTGGFGYARRYGDTCSFLVYIDDILMHVQINEETGETTVTAKSSSSPASSGPLRVWINEANTTEQIAENISTYNAIKDKHHENIVLCYEESNGEWEASATMPVSVEYEAVNDDGVAFLETIIASDPVNSSKTHVMLVRLYNDGTTEISFQHEQSNGQLVIYSGTINADGTATLSDEEKSANMSIYNALMSGQVMPIVYKQDLTQVMGYARIWSNVVADVYPEYGVQIKASYAASLGALESQNFVLNPDGTLDFDAI